jgi:hypothetical protein
MVEDSNPVSDVDDVGRRQKKSLPRWLGRTCIAEPKSAQRAADQFTNL